MGGITGQKRKFIYIITEKAAGALRKRSENYYVDLRRCLDRTSCCRKPFGFGLVIGQIWFLVWLEWYEWIQKEIGKVKFIYSSGKRKRNIEQYNVIEI